MRKIYLSLLLIVTSSISMAQNGQIYNGGFENWSDVNLYDYPVDWGNSNSDEFRGVATVLKSTDAQLGTYSAEIRAEEAGPAPDTLFGYVYHGSVGGSGPDGGIAYTNTFDQVRVQYKSGLPVGDTLYLLVIRFNLGVMTEMLIEPAASGTVGSWTQATINLTNNPQDELFIGFVMGDPFSGIKPTPGAWARIDNVQMYNSGAATTNVPDPSFENWSTATTEVPNNWFTLNEMLAGMSAENAIKSIDANSGTYAIELSTFEDMNSGDTIRGFMSMGPFDFNGPMPFLPAPYVATPTTFSGAYKYAPANGDVGSIQIQFLQGGTPIGFHSETFNAAGSYTTFSSALTIAGTPDSIIFIAFAGDNPGSVLKLDDLSFSGGDVSIEEFQKMNASIFPNPANEKLMIQADGTYSFELINITGQIVLTETSVNGVQIVDLNSFESGTYIVRIHSNDTVESLKLIIE